MAVYTTEDLAVSLVVMDEVGREQEVTREDIRWTHYLP